jgi:predicted nuclease of restriction endonuclease-like (RecB) superfamily
VPAKIKIYNTMAEKEVDNLQQDGTIYKQVKKIIDTARSQAYRTVNTTMLEAYWNIGRTIVEEEQGGKQKADYGKQIIRDLSVKLMVEYGKGFNITNLKYMRQFYITNPIGHALRGQLTWTHHRLLLKVENQVTRDYYTQEAINGNWSTRTLERQINSLYYERILMSSQEGRQWIKKEAENKKERMKAADIIKEPYVLEFLNLKPNTDFYETELEHAIINKLQQFMLELGKGFAFVSRQFRITTEDTGKHFFADLVFYNYILKCFLIIDLKTGELTHQDVGQMDFYVRYFEDNVKQENDSPTIGLILCKEKSKTIVKYSLLSESKQIFASKYQMYFPTEKQLLEEMKKEIFDFEQQHEKEKVIR